MTKSVAQENMLTTISYSTRSVLSDQLIASAYLFAGGNLRKNETATDYALRALEATQ